MAVEIVHPLPVDEVKGWAATMATAALSARRYAVADRVVLDVVDDDLGGFATGRFVRAGRGVPGRFRPARPTNHRRSRRADGGRVAPRGRHVRDTAGPVVRDRLLIRLSRRREPAPPSAPRCARTARSATTPARSRRTRRP